MAPAVGAMHFHARHAVRAIRRGRNGAGQRPEEAGPARAALVLGARLEQRMAAGRAAVFAGALLVVERAGAGAFGAMLAQHAELLGREQAAPLGVGFLDREVFIRHFNAPGYGSVDRGYGSEI